jgi:ribosome-binding protein aMBF1 (putative translation factor)
MSRVVSCTTNDRNTFRGIFYHAKPDRIARTCDMPAKSKYQPTYIRQWRNHRGMSLDQLAERVPMDKSNLSKVERGLLPYNQEMLERLADALRTDVASLLMRNPADGASIWSLWDHASPGERRQIESVVSALVSTKKSA